MNTVVGACVVFLSLAATVSGGEYCLTNSGFNTQLEYCSQQCCGDWPDAYCCYYDWVIPVIVVACIAGVSLFVCCICVCAQQGNSRGTVVAPAGGQSTVTTIAYTNPGQPNYGYQPPPPGYNQHPAPGYNQLQGYNQYPPPNVPGMPQQGPAYPPPMSNQPPTAVGNANNDEKTP